MDETTFYPIYDSGDGVRPGLCVIISQDVFDEVSERYLVFLEKICLILFV